jgi:hypothetical protein
MKVDITEAFASIMARMQAAKPDIERRHSVLLSEGYDLSDRPARSVMMERNLHLDWLAWVSTNLAILLGSPSEMFSGWGQGSKTRSNSVVRTTTSQHVFSSTSTTSVSWPVLRACLRTTPVIAML